MVSFLIYVIFTFLLKTVLIPKLQLKKVVGSSIFKTYLENAHDFCFSFRLKVILLEVLTIGIFVQCVRYLARSWLPARSIVMKCLEARLDVDPSGEVMVLNRFCPVSKFFCTFRNVNLVHHLANKS